MYCLLQVQSTPGSSSIAASTDQRERDSAYAVYDTVAALSALPSISFRICSVQYNTDNLAGAEALDLDRRLLCAAEADDLRAAKDAIDTRANIDGSNRLCYRLLMLAAAMGKVGMVKLLIEKGAVGYTCLLYTSPSPRD